MEPIRIALSAMQQRGLTDRQNAVVAHQGILQAYVQGITDGIDAPNGTKWALEGTTLVGTPPTEEGA